jgi:hypothetical protein
VKGASHVQAYVIRVRRGTGFGRAAGREFGIRRGRPSGRRRTTTPIKHLVVIFQENVSFDHYFGTYPKAANTSGSRSPRPHTPRGEQPGHNTKGAGGQGTC